MSSPSLEECSMCGIIVKYNIYPSRTILKIIGTTQPNLLLLNSINLLIPKYYNIIIEKSYNSTAIKKKFKIGDYILVTGIFDIFDSKLFHVDDINDKIKIHMKRCYNIEKINKLKIGIIMNNNNNRKVTDGGEDKPHKKINKFEKQKQGEIVTKFIMDMIKTSTLMKDNQTPTDYLNAGSGVLDVAGGNGWCSLGLALCGVKSTCLDSSPSVGCLPSRYRKFLRRAIEGKIELEKKNTAEENNDNKYRNHPNNIRYVYINDKPIMYDKCQAYFTNCDVDVNNDNALNVPICNINSHEDNLLLKNCSFVVGLHPDQATGAIVEFAVKSKKPFLVVPCCVFSRLFPNRFVYNDMNEKKVVSTKNELIDWCVSLDPENIKVIELPFKGSNIGVYSTFTS